MLLMIVFCAAGALLTGLWYLLWPALSPWWIPLLLIGGYAAVAVLFFVGVAVASLFLPKEEGGPHREPVRRVIVAALQWALLMLGYRVTLTGRDQLPDRPFLLVCNHLSAFDPIVKLAAMPERRMAFVSKPENMAIPVAGPFLRAASFLSIDRDSARNAVATVRRAAEFITDRKLCMGIYPEGTRSKTGKLLEFRSGAFKIAQMAHCPVVVMSVRYGRRRLWHKPVTLRVLEVMDEAQVAENRTAVISERAHALIAADGE